MINLYSLLKIIRVKILINSGSIRRWLRFLTGGAINTGFSYLIYLVLIKYFIYHLAYAIAYTGGIMFAYWFNSRFVFDVPISLKRFFLYPLVYVIQYTSSAILLGFLVDVLQLGVAYAPLAVSAIMTPLTYLITKIVLNSKKYTTSRLHHEKNTL